MADAGQVRFTVEAAHTFLTVLRMIEKILMLLFTTFTIVFAAVMLYDNQDPPVITEEIMGTST